MNPLQELLGAARGARWLGQLAGLAAYALLAFCGLGGELAWTAVIFMAPALLLAELLFSLGDRRGRRLKALAKEALPLSALPADARLELQAGLLALPRRAGWRAAMVGGLAALLVRLGGVSWAGAGLLLACGLPLAALLQTLVLGVRVQRVLVHFELGGDPAGALDAALPSLARRFRLAVLAPLGVALAPLALLLLLDQAVPPLVLGAAALLGLAAGAATVAALRAAVEEPLEALREGFRHLAAGEEPGGLRVTDGGPLGRLLQEGRSALAQAWTRETWLRQAGAAPPLGARLEAASSLRPVAVLALRWSGAAAALAGLAPLQRLTALKRVGGSFRQAVEARQGWILEASPGRWVAVWGAPWALADGQGIVPALAAAWTLQGLLPVLAQQARLRDGLSLDWGLGLASGQAAGGLGGSGGADRYDLQGGPLDEALRLAVDGGVWLDERSAAAAPVPYAAQVLPQGLRLAGGPEVQVLPGLGLGFEPGQRL